MWYVYMMIGSFIFTGYFLYRRWRGGKNIVLEEIKLGILLILFWWIYPFLLISFFRDYHYDDIIFKGKEKQ